MSGWKKNKHGEWVARMPGGLAGQDVVVTVDGHYVDVKAAGVGSCKSDVKPRERRAFIVMAVSAMLDVADTYTELATREQVRADAASVIEWAIALPKVPK
jgi:hypothetical protein